ncbi:MAG: hypothetical protein ACTTKH_01515 [Treponema sp.]
MTPLTRVEKEHIFSVFSEEKPNLYIVSKNEKLRLLKEHYINEDGIIKIKTDLSRFINYKKLFAFFFHKKVKICFQIKLEKNAIFSFKLPETAYIKEKPETNHSLPVLQLFYQNLLISTFLSANMKYLKEKTFSYTNDDIKEAFELSNNMGHDLSYLVKAIKNTIPYKVDLYSHINIINDFLLKKKNGKLKKHNQYVFSDSNIILLFSTEKFAKQLNNKKEFLAKISFSNRNIFCNVRYELFSPFLNKDSQPQSGFLLLKIIEIQEEDKRYLYESVYTTQYGSF